MDEQYGRYLCSREWALKKRAVKDRCRGVCERCNFHSMEHVHHLTYIRKFNERLEDLQGVCKGCHDFIHAITDIDPAEYVNWLRSQKDRFDERMRAEEKARRRRDLKRARRSKATKDRLRVKLCDSRLADEDQLEILNAVIKCIRIEQGLEVGCSLTRYDNLIKSEYEFMEAENRDSRP
jgi:hypothetical protein